MISYEEKLYLHGNKDMKRFARWIIGERRHMV
jgi:hypothetical protein